MIRKFQSADLEQVLRISRESFSQPWPRSEFEKYFENSLVAEENKKIAGFMIGVVSENQGVVKLIAVNKEYRGQGIGKSLMEFIFNHFQQKGVKEIQAHTRIQNESGITFLKSFGFEIIETVKNYYLNGENAYLMKKKL